MTITKITDTFSTSGAMTEQDLEWLADNKISLLINVRPDNEAQDQKSNAQWQAVSKKLGMDYVHIPVTSGHYTVKDIRAFAEALNSNHERVHSFCRSGARAIHLWALVNKNSMSYAEIASVMKDNGFDITPIAQDLK